MATKEDFTEEEWARLERAPFVAGMAISMADPGGPIEAVKETMADVGAGEDEYIHIGDSKLDFGTATGSAQA